MAPVCVHIPPLPDPLTVSLPGGVALEQLQLLQVIGPALTPLLPLFDVVDAIVAVFQCIKAIPDALGPPPDPSALAARIPELTTKVGKLLRLVPQLSLPATIVGIVDLVLEALRQARRQLEQLQLQLRQISLAVDRATELGDAGLLAVAVCAEGNVAQEAANVGSSLASLGNLIGLLNVFLGMVGGPQAPDLSSLAGRALEEAIPALDVVVEAMQTLRRAVPVP